MSAAAADSMFCVPKNNEELYSPHDALEDGTPHFQGIAGNHCANCTS